MAERAVFALVAEFNDAETLLDAVRRAREAGYTRFEAFSPFPIEGLKEALGFSEPWVPLATLLGGIAGAAIGFLMQVYTSLDYPIDIEGRPTVAPQAFMLITFELMVLFAVTACIVAMLLLNRLPKLSHPVFELERFGLASLDRFFLVIDAADEKFDRAKSRALLKRLGAVSVEAMPAPDIEVRAEP